MGDPEKHWEREEKKRGKVGRDKAKNMKKRGMRRRRLNGKEEQETC